MLSNYTPAQMKQKYDEIAAENARIAKQLEAAEAVIDKVIKTGSVYWTTIYRRVYPPLEQAKAAMEGK